MKTYYFVFLLTLLCSVRVQGQAAGTPADPFTTLAEARNVTSAGNYNFRLGGVDFRTYVSADGYVQIVYDNSNAKELLPVKSDLPFQTYGILPANVLSKLGGDGGDPHFLRRSDPNRCRDAGYRSAEGPHTQVALPHERHVGQCE